MMWLKVCLFIFMAQVLWAHKSREEDKSSSSSRELMKRWASRENSGEYGASHGSSSRGMEFGRGHGGFRKRGKFGGKSGSSSSESDSDSESSEEGGKGGRIRKMMARKMWWMKKRGMHSGGSSSESNSGSMERGHGGHKHGKCSRGHKHLFWRSHWGHKGRWGRKGGKSGSSSSESGSRSFERRGKHHRWGHHGRRGGKFSRHGWKHHFGRRHHRRQCPAWQPWQQSKCLWPTMDFSAIPEACHSHPAGKRIPQVLQDYKTAKVKEMYDVIQTLFKNRGANKACGFCSRKIQCRIREESEKRHFGCKPKEIKMVDEECEGHEACQLSLVLGGCPAPMPQRHLQMMQHHKKGHHFGQHGQFHHYMHHWGHGGFDHSGENKRHWRGPRSAEVDDDALPEDKSGESRSNETNSGGSTEKITPSSQGSQEGSNSGENQVDKSAGSSSSSSESQSNEQWGHRNHTSLPLWHCVKSKDGKHCLCCCGDYFPDVSSGMCKQVKHGGRWPSWDMWSLTSGGMPTGEKK